jgi:competence protein ComEA
MYKWISALPCLLLAASCWAGQPVNINTADAAELAEALDGVGQSKAELIVKYREMHGDFKHADELVNVRGIGLSTVDKNRENISVTEPRKVASGQQ